MKARELNIGDVFRVVGEDQLWRKASHNRVRAAGQPDSYGVGFGTFSGQEIEIVEHAGAAEIRRSESTLILKGGEVTLKFHGPWRVHSYIPGDPRTEFVLSGDTFGTSYTKTPTEDTALAFMVNAGAKHFNRAKGSDIFAYKGRVYARAIKEEVGVARGKGGYKTVRKVDGARRLIIVGLLTLPGEFALYDIIQEHFGPDAVPNE